MCTIVPCAEGLEHSPKPPSVLQTSAWDLSGFPFVPGQVTLHQESATVLCQQGQIAIVFLESAFKLILSVIIRFGWHRAIQSLPVMVGG